MPISLPFIALLFLWKRGVTLYDHIVLRALRARVRLVAVRRVVVARRRCPWIELGAGLAARSALPVHMFFHLKGAYALGWWSALWRTFFMMIFAFIVAIIF